MKDLSEPAFVRFLEILESDAKPDRGLRTLLARLAELRDYGFFEPSPIASSLWESDEPIVIRVHAIQNEYLQRAFAFLTFMAFTKICFDEAFWIGLHMLLSSMKLTVQPI
jgi:DNA phosphorothioation-dependent restriction protein DptH